MTLALPRFRTIALALAAIAASATLLLSTRAQPQTPATIVMCVKAGLATGAHDGSSWADAFASLDAALAAAPTNAHLWVAEGTYKPLNTLTGFQINTQLKLYGGFVGDGTENSDSRHGSFLLTVLDGDILGNDDLGQYGDNADHVVSIESVDGANDDPGVVIDGFRIAHGYAGQSLGLNGAGISCHCSDLDVSNCTFDHNYAKNGGGIWFVSGCDMVPPPPTGTSEMTSILRVRATEFFNNHADQYGGAIFGERLRGWVVNSKFLTNLATLEGGAAFIWRVKDSMQFDFTDCVFWENHTNQASMSIGGALGFEESSAIAGNSARSNVINCTFAGNFASSCASGQAVSVSPNSVVGIYNSILYWNHDLCAGYCPNSLPIAGSPTVEFSDIQFGLIGSSTNISDNPLFTAGSPPPTSFVSGCTTPPTSVLPNLTLKRPVGTTLGSRCIDRADYSRLPLDLADLDDDGNKAEVIPVDLLESARWVDRHGTGEDPNHGAPVGGVDYLDMGAYERP